MFRAVESSQDSSPLLGRLPLNVRQSIYIQYALNLVKDPAAVDAFNFQSIGWEPVAGHKVSEFPALPRTCQLALRESHHILVQFAQVVFQTYPDVLWNEWKVLESPSLDESDHPTVLPGTDALRAKLKTLESSSPYSATDSRKHSFNHWTTILHGIGNLNPWALRNLSIVIQYRKVILEGEDKAGGLDDSEDILSPSEMVPVVPDLRGILRGAYNIEHLELVLQWDFVGRDSTSDNTREVREASTKESANYGLRYPLSIIRRLQTLKTLTLRGSFDDTAIPYLPGFLPGVAVYREDRLMDEIDFAGSESDSEDRGWVAEVPMDWLDFDFLEGISQAGWTV